eukprot:TRINITY_DN39342_c0_g1_i1.p1 TRINITY_DN39342_c0_g1~~TRINITY_DN39342_c0_g1_i1.p1  ORF type:complete len:369 (-),score=72.30 TRINITY_DN39342_c0_g1_i1:190-1296(-)
MSCAVVDTCLASKPESAAIDEHKLEKLPSSYHEGLVCKNTFLTLIEDLDTDDDLSESDESSNSKWTSQRARADSEFTGLDRLRRAPDAVSLATLKLDSCSSDASPADSDLDREAQLTAGEYVPMWCLMRQRDAETSMVVPLVDEESLAVAQEAGEAHYLWCWAQPDGAGGTIVTPCTDREQPSLEVPAAELACAPPAPMPDDFEPTWISGPCWPFNIAPTTLVLSGLPQHLTQDGLLEILDRYSLSGFYDFVYLAADPSTELNCGEAVINFTRHEYGLYAAAQLHGRTRWGTDDDEDKLSPCQVRWSLPLQGLEDLVREYRNHPWNSEDTPDDLRPQLFKDGWPTSFPAMSSSAATDKETTYFGFAGW